MHGIRRSVECVGTNTREQEHEKQTTDPDLVRDTCRASCLARAAPMNSILTLPRSMRTGLASDMKWDSPGSRMSGEFEG